MPQDPSRRRVLVLEGPLISSQMAHWRCISDYGIDLHLAGTMRGPNQEWWVSEKPEGVSTTEFSPRGWLSRGSLWWMYPGLPRLIRELEPDIVHIAAEPWALFYSQVPLDDYRVVGHGADNLWIHGSPVENFVRLRRARRILPRLAGFASWNTDGIRLAREHGLPAQTPTLVAPTRVTDPGPFRSAANNRSLHREQLSIHEEFAIGYVGRLLPKKGVDWLIRSIALARPAVSRLHLFGAGSDEAHLRQLVSELDIPATFHGSVSPDRIPAVMAALDLLVVPSLTTPGWTEQFGRVVIEGMLAGTPVITSDSGSLPEVVGEGGIVVGESDVKALADALALCADPSESVRMRKAALTWVNQRFTPEVMAQAYAEFWLSIRSR